MCNLKEETGISREPEELESTTVSAQEMNAPLMDNIKEKIDPILESAKEKAAPAVNKVKAAAEDAIDAVKDGADKIKDFFDADLPGLNVKNELFSELEQEAAAQKAAAKAKAAEMQALLEKMMGGKG